MTSVTSTSLSSRNAIYRGTLTHRRLGPGPSRSFSYEVAIPLLDLADVSEVLAMYALSSSGRPAPLWFRRADFLGPPSIPLERAVRDAVELQSDTHPAGRVALMANLRTWGRLFNPIALYFCYSANGPGVEQLLMEVENTPWHERTTYVVGPPGTYRFPKVMHVSPFLPMDVDYVLDYSDPDARMKVTLEVCRSDEVLFQSVLSLQRHDIARDALSSLLWDNPLPAHHVASAIYTQAARLVRLRAPFYAHPDRLRRANSGKEPISND